MRKMLTFLGALTVGTMAMAATSNTENVSIIKKKSVEIIEDSSEFHRLNKSVSATVSLTGLGPGFSAGTGLSIAKHLSPNQQVLVDLRSGNSPAQRTVKVSSGSNSVTSESNTKTQGFGVHYKQFTSNSFYFKTGIDHNIVDYSFNMPSLGGGFDYQSSFNGSATMASFVIGNQWQWENFTLGCDWVGYSAGLAQTVSSSKISASASALEKQDFLDDQDRLLGKVGSLTLLRFFIGGSF